MENIYKMEEHIQRVVDANLYMKMSHGFIYEIRKIEIGDTNLFYNNGNTFTLELRDYKFAIDEKAEDLLVEADRVSYEIIKEIDSHVSRLMEFSELSARLISFKRCFKIAVNNIVIIDNGNAIISFGVAVIN